MLSGRSGCAALIRRALGIGALALLLTVGVGAATPAGPRLAMIKHNWRPSRTTLITVGPQGGAPVRLAGGEGEGPDWDFLSPSWRPDGTEVAYTGSFSIFLAGASGSGARRLNLADAEIPIFAPDGRTIAFTRFGEAWTFDLASGEQRQLTPSRRGLDYVPSSFSPDGSTLLATRFDSHRTGHGEPVALHLDTGRITRFLGGGFKPVYSPDGSEIALFRKVGRRRTSDLFVLDVASGNLRRLTRTPHKDERSASWDPSGERIAFVRFRYANFEWANSIAQINADGTCDTEVISHKRTWFYGPAWQPGPGRAAGPIDC